MAEPAASRDKPVNPGAAPALLSSPGPCWRPCWLKLHASICRQSLKPGVVAFGPEGPTRWSHARRNFVTIHAQVCSAGFHRKIAALHAKSEVCAKRNGLCFPSTIPHEGGTTNGSQCERLQILDTSGWQAGTGWTSGLWTLLCNGR